MKIRVLLADDHQVVVESFAKNLAGRRLTVRGRTGEPQVVEFEVVGIATNAPEAVDLFTRLRPDVVVLDVRLPREAEGIEAVIKIREVDPKAHVLMLTAYDGDVLIEKAIAAGAGGYQLKEAPSADLYQAIWQVYSEEGKAPVTNVGEPLRDREVEVLRLMAKGLRNKEIGRRLTRPISERGVKEHVTAIIQKLGVENRIEALNEARRLGYLA